MKVFCKLALLPVIFSLYLLQGYAQVHPDEVNCTHGQEYVQLAGNDSVLRVATSTGKWVLQSRGGTVLTTVEYEYIGLFRVGRSACLTAENKWGFIDSRGTEVIAPIYESVQDFNPVSKTALVLLEGQWLEIDLQGVIVRKKYPASGAIAKMPAQPSHSEVVNRQGQMSRDLFPCPTNMGFENGNLSGWQCYLGGQRCVGGANSPSLSPSSPTNNRHTIIASSSARDYFGNFPLASPDGSNYFVRLGNTGTGAQAESISFPVTVPNGADNYSITFYYAVVFEDPGHSLCNQPRFMARVKDALTGAFLNCSVFDFTASGGLPGFSMSSSNRRVRYKPWDMAYINLGAYQNRQLIVEFITVDCGLGGHWGYAYMDVKNICDIAAQGLTSCTLPATTTLSGPPGFQTYTWWNQNLTTQVGTGNPLVLSTSPPIGTRYNLIVVPYSGLGCRDTLPVTTVKLAPLARFTAPSEQCFKGNRFTFRSTSTTTSPTTLTNILWRFSDGTTLTGETVTRSFPAAGTYSVTLVVTNDINCADSVTYAIRVKSSPTASFTAPADQCLRNNSFTFTSTSVMNSGAITGFNWNFGNLGATASGTTATYSYPATGTYTVRLITTADNGCADTVTRNVQVHPQPRATFTAPASQCFDGNSFTFNSTSTVTPGSISLSSWSFGSVGTASGTSVTYSFPTVGTFSVLLNVISDKGCIDTTRRTVTVYSNPTVAVTASGNLSFCQGDSIFLFATGQAGSGNLVGFQWYKDGVLIPGATGNRITVLQGGSYSVVATNSFGCTRRSALSVVIVHPLPMGDLQLPAVDYICAGTPLSLSAIGGASYQWYFEGSAIAGAVSNTYNALLPGQYSVELISAEGCKAWAQGTIRLKLYDRPTVNFSFPSYCILQPIGFKNLSDTLLSGDVAWSWNFGGTSSSTLFEPVHTFTNPGNQEITLTATPLKCPNFVTIAKKTIPLERPVPGIRYPAVNALFNASKQLSARNIGIKYEWAPIFGLNNHLVRSPIYRSQFETNFLIRIEAASGCFSIDTQLVRIFKNIDIFVPKGFSPNGDGHNDRLDVFLVGISRLIYFRVFNRWGQLLFETNDPAQLWDGTFNGQKQPLETYVWIAEGIGENGIKIVRRGQTILLR